ncbi:hypothetical protein BD408DRAFT_352757, partial [Parasitella parasitica]
IAEQESIYNHKVIWRFMDTVKMFTLYCKFIPGETRLQLALLETTGPFSLKDITRETTDYVKAAYGLLAMLHKIAYSYSYQDLFTNFTSKLK